MSHHIGNFEWMTNPTHPKKIKPISSDRIIELERALSKLEGILGDTHTWVLTGGLAIGAYNQSFYRDHFDIDIGLDERYLENITESAHKSGYVLASRTIMSKIGNEKKIDVYKKITPQQAIDEKRKNLRLVRTQNPTEDLVEHINIMDYFDLYTHRLEGMDMLSNEGNIIVPNTYHFGDLYYTTNGPIRLRSLRYLETLKKSLKSEVDKLDLKVIRELMAKR